MKERKSPRLLTIEMFKTSCNRVAKLVNRQFFDNSRDYYWIGGDVGGLCDFGYTDVISIEDMVRILENKITYDQYAEWRDANIDNEKHINLKSWLMGARHEMFKEK